MTILLASILFMDISSLEASQLNQTKYFRCFKEKQASMYCLNSQCLKQNPFTCVDFNCQCQKNHEECEARAMIEVTLKRIKQKLNTSDKLKDDIESRFDKIIDQISEMRNKVVKEWGERIKTQGLTDIEKQFLYFSQGKQENYVFSTKKLITLSKSIKQKSENGTVITTQLFQKINSLQNKLKSEFKILNEQFEQLKDKYSTSLSTKINKIRQLSKNIPNPTVFNEFIHKKDNEFKILFKYMDFKNPTSQEKLKIKIFDMEVNVQFKNIYSQNLSKLKNMVFQNDIMSDIELFFELFDEVYLNRENNKIQIQKLSFQNTYCPVDKENQFTYLMIEKKLINQADQYKLVHKQQFIRAQLQKITSQQIMQSIKTITKCLQQKKEQIVNYLTNNIQKFKKQYLVLIVIDYISFKSKKQSSIKYMFTMEDMSDICLMLAVQNQSQSMENIQQFKKLLQQLFQCIKSTLSKFKILPEQNE